MSICRNAPPPHTHTHHHTVGTTKSVVRFKSTSRLSFLPVLGFCLHLQVFWNRKWLHISPLCTQNYGFGTQGTKRGCANPYPGVPVKCQAQHRPCIGLPRLIAGMYAATELITAPIQPICHTHNAVAYSTGPPLSSAPQNPPRNGYYRKPVTLTFTLMMKTGITENL